MKTKTLTLFTLLSTISFGQSLNEVKYMDKIIDLIHENKANLEYIDSLELRLTACEHIRTESIKHDLEQNKALSVANEAIGLLSQENADLIAENVKQDRKIKRRNRLIPIVGIGGVVVGGVLVLLIK